MNIDPFCDTINSGYWTFDSSSVPINGILKVPSGSGSFPLVIFVHGNHDYYAEYSDEGYEYLCELLASWGILAATIDANFLNGSGPSLENDARAILHLEHVKQFKSWNTTPSHPLYGKVNMSRIMIVGHSRGGEGVAHASYFNTLSSVVPNPDDDPVLLDGSGDFGPYGFSLKAVVAIAPTNNQYIPVTGSTIVEDNYFIIHGSMDGDVSNFQGYKTYDRSHPITSNPVYSTVGFKALLWVRGANHNFFNSSWNDEWWEYDYPPPPLSRTEQEHVAKVYIGALAQGLLLRDALYSESRYLELFKDHEFGRGWLPSTDQYVSQYQPKTRRFINHYQEDTVASTLSSPNAGNNNWSGVAVSDMDFAGAFPGTGPLYQETRGVRLTWSGTSTYYRTSFSSAIDASPFSFFAVRVGQSTETYNPSDADQDFTIQFQDGSSGSVSFRASTLTDLIYPDSHRVVMQTIRIPLDLIKAGGVDITDIISVRFNFDQTSSGRIYMDEMQFSN